MIIAQVSDLHIGFGGQDLPRINAQRFNQVIDTLLDLKRAPDVLVITGDLAEHGEVWEYEMLKAMLSRIPFPIYFSLGNHDKREAFQQVFPDIAFTDGFLQYTVENLPVRIIVLDTLQEGKHGGSFCETRGKWLDTELAKQPSRPTFIALHHPPIQSGIAWITASPNEAWVKRLHQIISKYNNIEHIAAGHIHRSIFKLFAKTPLSVTHAIAPQSKLELADIDPNHPDDRGLIVEGRPGFCLHQWDGDSFTTHFGQSPHGETLVKFDEDHAFILEHTMGNH